MLAQWNCADLVLCFCKSTLGCFVETLEDIDFYRAALTATDVIEDAIDRLFGVVAGHGGLGICQ